MATITADDYSPIAQGDVGAPFSIQFLHKNDGTPVNLTGATITMKMQEAEGALKICTGSWVIDSAINGQAHYNYSAADVSTVGNWSLYITITIGGASVHADDGNGNPKKLQITYAS